MSLNKFLKYSDSAKSATITNFSSTGTDSYGDTTTSSSASSTDVIIQRNLTESDVDVTEAGQDVRISAIIFVDDEETIEDGENANFPTEITVDSKDYEVVVADLLPNGYYQCLVQRI